MIENFIKEIPGELGEESGKVFYSGREAFSGARPLYILGYNPGGDPLDPTEETVEAHTQKVLCETPPKWSAYCDERWPSRGGRKSWVQPNILHLLQRLKIDPGEVPASNLFFVRDLTKKRYR